MTRTTFPADDREVVIVAWPRKRLLSFSQFLQLHCQLSLANFVVGEHLKIEINAPMAMSMCRPANLEMAGKTKLLAYPDEPFGGIILIPPNCVSVVHRELVVKVVIALSNCDQGGDQMVARRVFVIKRRFSQPVCKGIDTKRGLREAVRWEEV